MKNKIKHRLLLIVIFAIFSMGFDRNLSNNKDVYLNSSNTVSIYKGIKNSPDVNLLIGEWSRLGTRNVIKIREVLENGKLELELYNPNKIEIEKANWSKTGNLLSVYIEFQSEKYPGSNYKLNYIPERDILVGDHFQAIDSIKHPVEFIRMK